MKKVLLVLAVTLAVISCSPENLHTKAHDNHSGSDTDIEYVECDTKVIGVSLSGTNIIVKPTGKPQETITVTQAQYDEAANQLQAGNTVCLEDL